MWPLAVIAGQLVLLAIAYGFIAALFVERQIPLSWTVSALAQRSPQSMTYLFTFVATALSAFSS
jgi:predicted outer membrane lipoprotein